MTRTYHFPACGCEIPIDEGLPDVHGHPALIYPSEVTDLPLDCSAVWEMLGAGSTKGVFQLESPLGRQWTKKLKPESVEHLAALGSILRPGCIGGDTKVGIALRHRDGRKINIRKMVVRQLYNQFKRGHINYKNKIVSLCENSIILFNNIIENVIYSGQKEVYKIGVANQRRQNKFYNLECTLDHKLLTYDEGWLQLEDIQPGQLIAVVRNRKVLRPRNLGEKSLRDICWLHYEYHCVFCDWIVGSLDVNHLEGNRKYNNNHENLCFMCPNHHRMYSEGTITKEEVIEARKKYILPNSKHIEWIIYTCKKSVGIKDTYDIRVKGPNHNFIAGNVVVHNCLKAKDEDGISMTEHYCLRKNGEEEVSYFHPSLKPILSTTYGVLCYQEQSIAIVSALGGFSLVEADTARKAAAKKSTELMAKVKKDFIEKAGKLGIVTTQEAETIFGWIEKSQMYSFNYCLSFDTTIKKGSRGKYGHPSKYTIEHMYRIRNDLSYAKINGHEQLRKKWNRIGNYGKGWSLCQDGRIRPNIIQDIQPAGVQKVYKVVLKNGFSIRVTENHKFPTDIGIEMTVEELLGSPNKEISLYFCGEYEKNIKIYKYSDLTKEQRKSGRVINTEQHKWFTNGSYTLFQQFRETTPDVCFDCGKRECRIETHHINSDRSNSGPDNLVKLCVSCHKRREYAAGRVKRGEKGYPSIPMRIVSIVEDGQCMTYNVTMAAPHHNFVANDGIVTSNSHAMSYGLVGYHTAHPKAHFPLQFYTSYLYNAKEKQDPLLEIRQLINDAKTCGIEVLPPRFEDLKYHFSTDGVLITFGLSDVKGISQGHMQKMRANVKTIEQEIGKPVMEWSWYDFLIYFSPACPSNVVERLIEVGAMRKYPIARQRMLAEYNAYSQFTEKEQKVVSHLFAEAGGSITSLVQAIEALLDVPKGVANKNRRDKVGTILKMLQSPPRPLVDTPEWIAKVEEECLGIPITCSKVKSASIDIQPNMTCQEFRDGKTLDKMVFAVEIQECREVQIQNGQNRGKTMAFLVIGDASGALEDVCIFSDAWSQYGNLIYGGASLELCGRRDPKRQSFIVEEVYRI